MKTTKVLAIDFGASTGRAIIGSFDGEKITLEEIHRFENTPISTENALYWDFDMQFGEIKIALKKAAEYSPVSVGIDTWGVDFGLIGKDGKLLENPAHYRDSRTDNIFEKAFAIMPKKEIYEQTGIQFMQFNTLYQLLSLKLYRNDFLKRADKLLFVPNLFNYHLTGKMQSEYSFVSTTQLQNPRTGKLDDKILDAFEIDKSIFAEIVDSGSDAGTLKSEICQELNIKPIKIVNVAAHDTASAVVAVPSTDDDFLYISSGTWSLMGIENDTPIINEQSFAEDFTNEGGYNRNVRFLKNIMGLWLVQESRRQWKREGEDISFAELEKQALDAPSFRSFIDTEDTVFLHAGDIPSRIREFCKNSGQPVPETKGEIMRCIYESLAFKYRSTKEKIEKLVGKTYDTVHIVGGGGKDKLLCQFSANATGSKVITGPTEATALGNIAVQLIADGKIKDIKEARKIIANSSSLETYLPNDSESFNTAYQKFIKLIG